MHPESSKKVNQILMSSDRVKKARRMVGLKKDEYIARYSDNKAVIGNYRTEKTRMIKEIKGQPAGKFIDNEVASYIQKEIVEYFGVPIVNGVVCVLMGRPHSSGYDFGVSFVSKGPVIRTLTIGFKERLNAEKLRNLFRQIREWNDFDSQTKYPYDRTKPIDFFDEKFILTREYEALKKKYPKKIPPQILSKLIEKTKKLLKIKTTYTADSFRKTISEFKKSIRG